MADSFRCALEHPTVAAPWRAQADFRRRRDGRSLSSVTGQAVTGSWSVPGRSGHDGGVAEPASLVLVMTEKLVGRRV